MTAFESVLAEFGDLQTGWVLLSALVAAVLLRVTRAFDRRRAGTMLVVAVLHLLVALAGGLVRAQSSEVDRDLRLVAMVLGVITYINAAGNALFLVALPKAKLAPPRILQDVLFAIAYLAAVFVIASRMGLNLSGLIATSTVVTAVIGFSLQDTLGNVMGGLALQLDNSIEVGDWVKVGDVAGRVREIRWRYTAIETRNWETVVIPNSLLMKGQVTVLGRRDGAPVQWRRWVYFNIDFRYPPPQVIETIQSALRAAPIERVAADPPPNCILMDLQESYGRYAVRYWLTDLAADDPTDSAIRTVVYFALKRAHVPLSIPAHALFITQETEDRSARKESDELKRRVQALAKVELFASLSEHDHIRLANALDHAPFAKDEVMTRQGAEAHWLYMILSGTASVRFKTAEGVEREVARLEAGQFFGEMSLMTGAKRSATVVAVTEVSCYRLDKGAFQELIHERPELAAAIAEVLAHRAVEQATVKEGLDAEARAKRMAAERDDLLGRIQSFFGGSKG